MSYGGQVAAVFNQLASIYGQMGRGIPGDGRPDLKGKQRLRVLQGMLGPAQQELNNYRNQQLQQQMMSAQRAQASRMAELLKPKSQPRTLQSTLAASDAGVRSRRSRTQQLAMEQGVRASNQLQAGPYLGPQGGRSATPYGSSINLA
jgi:hypothetical protein